MPIKNEDKLYGTEIIIKLDMLWALTSAWDKDFFGKRHLTPNRRSNLLK